MGDSALIRSVEGLRESRSVAEVRVHPSVPVGDFLAENTTVLVFRVGVNNESALLWLLYEYLSRYEEDLAELIRWFVIGSKRRALDPCDLWDNLQNKPKRGVWFDCPQIEVFDIPGSELFSCRCQGYQNLRVVRLESGVSWIPPRMFAQCYSLEEVALPDSLTSLPEQAFQDCTSLVRIRLPRRLKMVRRACFAGCTNLEKITFPQGFRVLCRLSFARCPSLHTVEFRSGIRGRLLKPAFGQSFWKIAFACVD